MKRITTATILEDRNTFYLGQLNDGTNEMIRLKARSINYIYGGRLDLKSEEFIVPVIGTAHRYNAGQFWWIPDYKRIMAEREPESQTTEYKSSLLHTNFDCPANDQPRLQMDELAKSAIAGWNSGQPLDIYVGVDDRTRAWKGLSQELKLLRREEYIAQFRNHLSQISSGSFFTTIQLSFECLNNNREVFHIHVPANERGDLVLLKGTQLWVRLDASNHQLKNEALLQYITNKTIQKLQQNKSPMA